MASTTGTSEEMVRAVRRLQRGEEVEVCPGIVIRHEDEFSTLPYRVYVDGAAGKSYDTPNRAVRLARLLNP